MPELPDVELFKRHVDATSLRRKIRHVDIRSATILKDVSQKELVRRLKNRAMKRTHRHGKYLGIECGSDLWLVMHFGMTGYPEHVKKGEEPPKFSQVIFEFTDGSSLVYVSRRKLGKIRLEGDLDEFIVRQKLGSDPLDPSMKLTRFREIVGERKGGLKPMLMNQSVVAGLGNVYVDEILFHAGLHPESSVERLDGDQVKQLYRAMEGVLKMAIKKKAQPKEMPATYLLPRRGETDECPKGCGKMKRKTIGGRTTWFCPACQKRV